MIEAGIERAPRHHREQRDIRGRQSGRAGNRVAALRGGLRRDPDAHISAIGRGGGGARFDRRVQRGRNSIFGRDFLARVHRLADVALADDTIAITLQREFQRVVDAVRRNRRAFGLEHRRKAVERAVRCPPVARDRRDPALMRHNIQQAGRGQPLFAIDALQPCRAERPLTDRREHHIGQTDIACIIRRPVDLGRQIKPCQLLAVQRVRTGRAIDGLGGRFEQGGGSGDFAEAQLLLAEGDEAVLRVALLPIGIPALCRCHHQKHARLRRGIAARRFEHAHRRAVRGQHHRVAHRPFAARPTAHVGDEIRDAGTRGKGRAIFVDEQYVRVERVDRRGFDRDRAPVGAEFVGHDLRQQRGDALPHLALRDDRADMSVVADLQKGVEDMLVGSGGQIGQIVARPQAPRNRQSARGRRADKQRTAADERRARFVFPHSVANAGHARC